MGGILAVPVNETVKQVTPTGKIAATLQREGIWLAQTPQMFRLGLLKGALQQCATNHLRVTDEASAIQAIGLVPQVVLGSRCNIKITTAEDLALAEFFLTQSLEPSESLNTV